MCNLRNDIVLCICNNRNKLNLRVSNFDLKVDQCVGKNNPPWDQLNTKVTARLLTISKINLISISSYNNPGGKVGGQTVFTTGAVLC